MANTNTESYKYNKKIYNTLTNAKNLKPPFIRNYSTGNNSSNLGKLNPDFVSGFIDAEASFSTVVYYKNR